MLKQSNSIPFAQLHTAPVIEREELLASMATSLMITPHTLVELRVMLMCHSPADVLRAVEQAYAEQTQTSQPTGGEESLYFLLVNGLSNLSTYTLHAAA
ncbi:hypothetical protein HER32_06625 [Hymenobacter sp. BT18]|uniref:hypothetical protein n=1 Tax=Hymenobacter sp. BT18 TaxID=2835648 RepID=UPI00143EA506|nr:hypothetical protein [Hymenobacter sp. BT18]QIX60867.1 hypothetical protein HER32_06625 [Hymenobacter sp. BT18]